MLVPRSKKTSSISATAQVTWSDMPSILSLTVASGDVTTSLGEHLITLAVSFSLGTRL